MMKPIPFRCSLIAAGIALASQGAFAQVPQPGPEGPKPGQETGEAAMPIAGVRPTVDSPFAFVPPQEGNFPDGSRLQAQYESFKGGRALPGARAGMAANDVRLSGAKELAARLPAGFSLGEGVTVQIMKGAAAMPAAARAVGAGAGTSRFTTIYPLQYKNVPISKGSDYMTIVTGDGLMLAARRRHLPTNVDATEPSVSPQAAVSLARQSAGEAFTAANATASQPRLEIWVDDGRKGHLAWTFTLDSTSLAAPQSRQYWVSAVGAPRVLSWQSGVFHTHFGAVTGTLWETTPLQPTVNQPLSNLRVDRLGDGGGNTFTAADGRYAFTTGTGSATISAGMNNSNNRYSVVDNMAGSELVQSRLGTPASAINLNFGATGEFQLSQVTAYGWTNVGRGIAGTILAPTELANTPTRVNIDSSCNAFYRLSDQSINFFRAGGSCPNTAYSDVVLHEYGHGVDHMKGGILDGGYSEGFGDAMTILGTRQPCLGRDFLGAGTCLRPATDVILWPPASGEGVHAIGRRYAGFVWELVQQLRQDYSADEAFAAATELVLAAAAANPSDIPDAVLLSFLADDDDGDLKTCSAHQLRLQAAADSRTIPRPANCVDVAMAPAGVDFSHAASSVKIASTSSGTPTVMRTVAIKCPANGYLIASADTQFNLYPTTSPGEAAVGYSIARNSTAFDWGHYHFLKEYVGSASQYTPSSMQRMDACSAGATYTYNFVAYRWANAKDFTYAWQPNLVVEYFPVRY